MVKRIISPLLSLVIVAAGLFYVQYNQPQTAYIEFSKVFEEFQMTKELQILIDREVSIRKEGIEKLKVEILEMGDEDSVQRTAKGRVVVSEIQKLEEFTRSKTDEVNRQILTRINDYAKQYGKENKLDYLYGATGDGSIMYANEARDATEEFIEYINKMYADKQE